jgi:hypothetical protein
MVLRVKLQTAVSIRMLLIRIITGTPVYIGIAFRTVVRGMIQGYIPLLY